MVATPDAIAVRRTTPWWYWLVAVLGVLWSLGGAYDYLMTMTENADYFADIPQPMLDYWFGLPTWLAVPWALAVWGGLLGWVLMLLRSRWAVTAFAVSLAAMAVNFLYMALDGGIALQAEHMGAGMAYGFTALVLIGGVFAVWYSRHMRARGVLR